MTTAATDQGKLLTIEEAATYLSDSPRHVRRLWQHREIAAVRVGRKVRFRVADLERYISSRRVECAVRPNPATQSD